MSEDTLFELPAREEGAPARRASPEEARVVRPVREQLQWVAVDLEEAVAQDHAARAIWGLLEKLDLSAFYGSIKAVVDRPGRPTTDPQVLLAVWLLATVEGVGSARRVARLCEEHDAYRWLCGGVPINYHMLADFRVAHQGAMDELLTQIVASLMAAKAVTLERVAQDGMKVRASAGASSYRRQEGLEAYLDKARAQVERMAWERKHPDPGVSERERSARERAARERVERVKKALEYLPQAKAAKERQHETLAKRKRDKITAPRASSTDPQVRVMKMPDGGFRPAYNVELATDGASGVIVGVNVVNAGDAGQAAPMEAQVAQRTGQHPKAYPDGWRFRVSSGHHYPGGTGRDRVRAGATASKHARGGPVPAPLRRWPGGGAVATAHGYAGSSGRLQAAGSHGRMDERAGTSARHVPVHGAESHQSHGSHALGGGGT